MRTPTKDYTQQAATPPKYYGLPKVHKHGMPLRPKISSIGSVTYSTAKEIARILKPLVGRSTHHVMNNLEFLESIKGIPITTRRMHGVL